MVKENVLYTHTHTLEYVQSEQKEGNPAVYDKINKPGGHCADETRQLHKDKNPALLDIETSTILL